MKLSAWHKSRKDPVEWWNPLGSYDRIYSSKVFDFTPENPYLPAGTIRGGTGYPDIPLNSQLPPEIDRIFPDYTLYPACDYAIGYLTRGCPNHCRWCIVPQKKGISVHTGAGKKLSARIPISWSLWTITSSQAVTGSGNWNA